MCGNDELPEFVAAADWWNARAGNVFERVPEEATCLCLDGGCPVLLITEGLTPLDPFDIPDSGIRTYARTHLARTDSRIKGVVIRYYDPYWDTTPETRMTIARHELGHALGMMHTDNERCLMYPTVDRDLVSPKTECKSELEQIKKHYERGM